MRTILFSLAFALAVVATNANPLLSKSTVYVHSNDTMKLTLRSGTRLFGMPTSTHALEFQFENDGLEGHFNVQGEGSDGFNGYMKERRFYLGRNMQKTITVSNLIVPQVPEDSTVMYTVSVTRDLTSMRKKREAPPNYNQDNSGNSGVGGSGGSGSYGGGNNNGGGGVQFPNVPDMLTDPTYRKDIALTVEFMVTDELSDDSKPDTELTYGAKSNDETCPVEPDSASCNEYMWWVSVEAEDNKSGLYGVEVEPMGAATQNDEVFYRYVNFAVGTTSEQEIKAAASCCLEGMLIRISDNLGNVAEVEAHNGGQGTPMSNGLKWGLIGGGIALLIIIIVVIVVCMRKGGYSRASSG